MKRTKKNKKSEDIYFKRSDGLWYAAVRGCDWSTIIVKIGTDDDKKKYEEEKAR